MLPRPRFPALTIPTISNLFFHILSHNPDFPKHFYKRQVSKRRASLTGGYRQAKGGMESDRRGCHPVAIGYQQTSAARREQGGEQGDK